MNSEEKLAKFTEQNRVRQKRHYEKNRELINEKRRQVYRLGRSKLALSQPESASKSVLSSKTDYSKSKSISYEQAVQAIDGLGINESTAAKYKQDLKRLLTITDCENLIKCFKEYKPLIEVINTSVKANGEPYSVNTRKSLYQMI